MNVVFAVGKAKRKRYNKKILLCHSRIKDKISASFTALVEMFLDSV